MYDIRDIPTKLVVFNVYSFSISTPLQAGISHFVHFLKVSFQNIPQNLRARRFESIQDLVVTTFESGFHFGKKKKVC